MLAMFIQFRRPPRCFFPEDTCKQFEKRYTSDSKCVKQCLASLITKKIQISVAMYYLNLLSLERFLKYSKLITVWPNVTNTLCWEKVQSCLLSGGSIGSVYQSSQMLQPLRGDLAVEIYPKGGLQDI